MKFIITFLALAIGAQATTVANILSDISTITADLNNLNTAINAFPNTGGTLVEALAIHTDVGTITTAINKAITDANNVAPVPISEADSQSILTAVIGVKPNVIAALAGIVAKKPAFTSLSVGGLPALIRTDLTSLNTATSAFEAALIARAPADFGESAAPCGSTISAALATAIAAYASS